MLLKRISRQLPAHLVALIPELGEFSPVELLSPPLTSPESAGVKTTENLLFTSPIHLRGILQQHQDELDQLIDACLRLTAPPEIPGDEAHLADIEVQKGSGWCGWGIPTLDEVVAGWEGVGVLEICGPNRVGKSLLTLHVVLRHLRADLTSRCRWLDADGSFHPARARAILDLWGEEDPNGVLDRLIVSPCFSIDPELYDALAAIQTAYVSTDDDGEGSASMRTKILVIDPLAMLLKDVLLTSSTQGHAAMVTILEEISELTYSSGMTTIVTNLPISSLPSNPASFSSVTTIRPALGTSFTYFADITLLVQETGRLFGNADEEERDRVRKKPGLRGVVEVLKSRVSPSGRWAVFETDGTSLRGVITPPLDDVRTVLMSAGVPTGPVRPLHGPLVQTVIP